jgi:hypothetical protein
MMNAKISARSCDLGSVALVLEGTDAFWEQCRRPRMSQVTSIKENQRLSSSFAPPQFIRAVGQPGLGRKRGLNCPKSLRASRRESWP